MKQTITNRIAGINAIVVAIVMAVIFAVIYWVVFYSSHNHLDNDLKTEKNELIRYITIQNDSVITDFKTNDAEEQQMEANPTFFQIVDNEGKMVFKSTNLRSQNFYYSPSNTDDIFFNDIVEGQRMRLAQFPLFNKNNIVIGHLTIGMSRQESYYVLKNLLLTLLISYFSLLVILYFVMLGAARRAIAPVKQLSISATALDENRLGNRLPLPKNKDEIHVLASTINELLQRIEKSTIQQKQFTADVSHELKTPLTAIRGTLEVLLRKQRTPDQYQNKLTEVLHQTIRLNNLYDEILEISKMTNANIEIKKTSVPLKKITEHLLTNISDVIHENNINIKNNIPESAVVNADEKLLMRILENIAVNAVKYNKYGGSVDFEWDNVQNVLLISDKGIGINEKQLPYIFDRFYRTDTSRSSSVSGHGIGLFIVKQLCDIQNIKINVKSKENAGTTFSLQFN